MTIMAVPKIETDMAWCPGIVGEVQGLVEYHVDTGAEVDDLRDMVEGAPVQVAESLSHACSDSGISMPETDPGFLMVLRRNGTPAPVAPRYGVVLVLADGRLAVGVSHGGVIESSGDSLTLIRAPETGRYVEAWFIPHVFYWEDI